MNNDAKLVGLNPNRSEPLATGLLSPLRRGISFILVMAGLVGVAAWGHLTDWTFTRSPRMETPSPSSTVARVRIGKPLPVSSSLRSSIRREVTVEFDSADVVNEAGIASFPVLQGAIADALEAPGEVQFDPALVTQLASRATGSVWRLMKKTGDLVGAGEVLALVDAADAGKAKAEFQRALVQANLHEKRLVSLKSAAEAVSAQIIREEEAAVKAAETRLLAAAQALTNLDLPIQTPEYRSLSLDLVVARMRLLGVPSNMPGVDLNAATANLVPVRAPFAGVVLSTNAVAGVVVESGRPIFTVADPRRVWVVLAVRANDAGRVKLGQTLRFRTDGAPDEMEGRVDWIAPTADESARSVAVRAVLSNDTGLLRAGTLGQGRVIIRQERQALLVPHAAVQVFRGTPVVFVRDPDYLKPGGPKAFRARPVREGAKDAANTEILAGLHAREVVATRGSELLLNELTRAIDGAKLDQDHVEEER